MGGAVGSAPGDGATGAGLLLLVVAAAGAAAWLLLVVVVAVAGAAAELEVVLAVVVVAVGVSVVLAAAVVVAPVVDAAGATVAWNGPEWVAAAAPRKAPPARRSAPTVASGMTTCFDTFIRDSPVSLGRSTCWP